MNEEVRHFSLRKLSVGLASVLVGVSIFGTSQIVKADTVANNQASTVTNNVQSSDTQENGNTAKSTFSNDNQANNAKSNLIQTQVEGKKDQKQDSAPKTQEATDSSNLDVEKDIVRTSSLQESDNQSNNHAEDNSQTQPQTSQKLDLTKNSKKFAKKVLATNLIETNSLATTNGGFDEATWGKLDVTKWQGSVQDGLYQLTNYTGDPNHIIVPNEADFEKAGKSTNGLQVGISSGTTQSLVSNRAQTIAFSKTNNQKVKAIGTDWSYAFSLNTTHLNLSKFDGSNLDVSNVTNMRGMFSGNSISNLTSLANWNVSNVTNMRSMFDHNSISDLTPLANWDVSKVTDTSYMFAANSINDLNPLANWDTSKITYMNWMFYHNSISDLNPLAHWNTSKVTDMNSMFDSNSISDLNPLAHWNTSNVTNMGSMFASNSISDLTPLTNWNTSKVTDMNWMFNDNSVSDLTPLAHWDTSKVTDMSGMFSSNSISDLTPLTNWDTSNVTSMYRMFDSTSISDLTPLANWNTSKVTDMHSMFSDNSVSDLTPLANWDTSKVTDMNTMFYNNKISDLTPLAHWNTSKVTDMNWMFSDNSVSDLTPLANWDTSKVTDMSIMFARNPDLIDLRPIANWNISGGALFYGDTKLNLTNINNTPLMQGFLKEPDALQDAMFITNNADLVKATINKDIPTLTNTAKRTIVFNIPHADPETIVQIINYKAIAPAVQVNYNSQEIVKTYPVKESDWQLDDSKQNDDVIIDGVICFKPVKIPHVNGYKAHLVRNKLNPAMLMVSFMAVPSEVTPSKPIEEKPSKPSAPSDSQFTDLDHKVVDALNNNDSGWTMPDSQPATYTSIPADDATIDLSDLVIAEPVHAQTRIKIAVPKRFKLRKKHSIKHLKHRKKAVRQFKKYRL